MTRRETLVIDPVLAYSTFLGGTGEEFGIEIAVSAHRQRLCDRTHDFAQLSDQAERRQVRTCAVAVMCFVTKFNAAGNQLDLLDLSRRQ